MKILVVDDAEPIRLLLGRFLGLLGHDVAAVASCAEAERALAGERFDLVVTDVAMPGGSGWQVLRRVRARHPGLPVVLMTGDDEPDAGRPEASPDAVLRKPVSLDRIREVLEGLVPCPPSTSSGGAPTTIP